MGLSEKIEIKFEINKEMIRAAKELLHNILKALDKYEERIDAIHNRDPESNK